MSAAISLTVIIITERVYRSTSTPGHRMVSSVGVATSTASTAKRTTASRRVEPTMRRYVADWVPTRSCRLTKAVRIRISC